MTRTSVLDCELLASTTGAICVMPGSAAAMGPQHTDVGHRMAVSSQLARQLRLRLSGGRGREIERTVPLDGENN